MKTIISLITIMVFVFAFGTAFAGERQMGKSAAVGDDRDMYASFESTDVPDPYKGFAKPEIKVIRDAAAGGLRAEMGKSSAVGDDRDLYASFESTDVPDPYKGFAKPEIKVIRDAAAGGLRADKIGPSSGGWDNLKASFESTDVPDPYRGFAK